MPSAVILDDSGRHDVLEVVALDGNKLRVRAPFLFEIGEELRLELADPGPREVVAVVRSHGADHVSELELT